MARGRIGMIVLGLLAAAALVYGFMPQPVPVEVFTALNGPLAVTVEEEGKTRVMERYVVSAPMTGYARRIELKVGDPVQSGQVLAQLEPARSDALDPRSRAQAHAQASAAEAALAVARENARVAAAEAKLARQEIARSETMGKSGFISAQAVDLARSNAARTQAAQQAAEYAVNVARFQLDTARAVLARGAALESGAKADILSVRSPVDARVLKVAHQSEGTVRAGDPLIEVGNPEALEVEVEVLSTSAVKISKGSKVILERWGGEPLQGAVRVVEPAGYTKVSALGVEEQRVRVIVDFTSPRQEWQRLGDGYRVEAGFVVWEGDDVLKIPSSALFRYDNGWAVFAADGDRARLKPIRVGQRSGLQAQVLEGLKPGSKVVVHPGDKVMDGVRIQVREVQ